MTVKEIVFDYTKDNLESEVLRISHLDGISREKAYYKVVNLCREFNPNYTPYKNYPSFRVSRWLKNNK